MRLQPHPLCLISWTLWHEYYLLQLLLTHVNTSTHTTPGQPKNRSRHKPLQALAEHVPLIRLYRRRPALVMPKSTTTADTPRMEYHHWTGVLCHYPITANTMLQYTYQLQMCSHAYLAALQCCWPDFIICAAILNLLCTTHHAASLHQALSYLMNYTPYTDVYYCCIFSSTSYSFTNTTVPKNNEISLSL